MTIVKKMQRLGQSEREALKQNYKTHKLFSSHIEPVLDKPYCLKVSVFVVDYSDILIASCLTSGYQPLAVAIEHIKNHPDFLSNEASEGCLDGRRVQQYIAELESCIDPLPTCFESLGDCFLHDGVNHPSGGLNVTDGMHRLVAYGLVTGMNEHCFPITVYFGADEDL